MPRFKSFAVPWPAIISRLLFETPDQFLRELPQKNFDLIQWFHVIPNSAYTPARIAFYCSG